MKKNIKKAMKESINNIELKPFQQKYNEIQDRLDKNYSDFDIWQIEKNTALKKQNKYKYLIIFLSLIILSALIAVIILNPFKKQQPITYFDTELDKIITTKQDFYTKLDMININIPNMQNINILSFELLKVKNEDKYVGGVIGITQETDNQTYIATIRFFINSIEYDKNLYIGFDKTYNEISTHTIKYKLVEFSDPLYSYNAVATNDTTTYIITYESLNDDITNFFDVIFSKYM